MATSPDPAQERVRATVDGVRQQFQEQIDFFRAKLNLPSERYDDIRGGAHNKAFMVAGVTKADLLQDLRGAVDKAVLGGSLGEFRKDFAGAVRRRGWVGWTGEGTREGEAWRTRVIYQTNVLTSRAAGRRAQLKAPALLARRPFWRYEHSGRVEHPRPHHKRWGDMRLTLPHDHPFWDTHFPPNGIGCMCSVVPVAALTEGDATEPPDGWDLRDERTGRLPGIDAGWDYAPGANEQDSLRQMVQDKLIDYPPAIAKALSKDLNRQVSAGMPVAEFATRALTDPASKAQLFLGFVEDAEAIARAAKVQVPGYLITLQADAVRLASAGQGLDGDAQRAPQPADFQRLAVVLNAADSLRAGALSTQGNPTVVATRRVGRETFRAVFEVLGGKRDRLLTLVSLAIKIARPRG